MATQQIWGFPGGFHQPFPGGLRCTAPARRRRGIPLRGWTPLRAAKAAIPSVTAAQMPQMAPMLVPVPAIVGLWRSSTRLVPARWKLWRLEAGKQGRDGVLCLENGSWWIVMFLFSKVGMDSELKYIDNILIAIVARFCTQLRRNFVFIDII